MDLSKATKITVSDNTGKTIYRRKGQGWYIDDSYTEVGAGLSSNDEVAFVLSYLKKNGNDIEIEEGQE